MKIQKKEKKKNKAKKEMEHDRNLIKEMWGKMIVKETLMLNEDFYSLAFFGHYIQTDETL